MLGALRSAVARLPGDLYERVRIWSATEHASPALPARRLVITHSWVSPLAVASGSSGWAAMFVGLINLRNATFARRLLERPPRARSSAASAPPSAAPSPSSTAPSLDSPVGGDLTMVA